MGRPYGAVLVAAVLLGLAWPGAERVYAQAGHPSEAGGGPGVGAQPAAITAQDLATYKAAREKLETDPNTAAALRQRVDIQRQAIEGALQGTGMTAEEWVRIHRAVQADPQLLQSSGTPAVVKVSQADLSAYVIARRKLEADPTFQQKLAGRTDLVRQEVEGALQGTGMTAEEFVRVHREVMVDPSLQQQVNVQLEKKP